MLSRMRDVQQQQARLEEAFDKIEETILPCIAMMLDTLLEVIDLAQVEASVRHAARADVVMTPRFGPGNWRDFHLADLFLEAGRRVAEEQLPALRALARPQNH